jgi:anti-sigma B factor antagonist
MDIQVTRAGGAAIVVINGPLGAGDSERLYERHVGRLIEEGERVLILDLSRVPRIDSIGLGGLVQMFVRMRNRGGNLRLAAPTPFVRNVLAITKLSSVFDIHDSVEHAITAQPLTT